MGPKIYNDISLKSVDQPSFTASSASLQNRILLKIHRIDQYPTYGPFQFIQRQFLIWTLRFLRLPHDQPLIWYATFIIQLWLISLPWFKAEFIPSASTDANRYGTFYLWGLVFPNKEWIPLADTWKLAVLVINLDVGFLYRFFAWRCTNSTELHCLGSTKGQRQVRQINEHLWFKGLEVIFWMWRTSVVIQLAFYYGGVWPTLILNVLMIWLAFIGVMLVIGKNGLLLTFRDRQRQRVAIIANGCRACRNAAQSQPSQNVYTTNNNNNLEELVEYHALEEQNRSNREREEQVSQNILIEDADIEENGSTSSHSSGVSSSTTEALMVHSRSTGNRQQQHSSYCSNDKYDNKLD
ncbi:hypothetical protein BDC45DRAFT_308683 [Circinella umbellata]|nr:hypothetical protein BDC45DRAFT_308683 [Circinella umbellata]